MLEPLAVVPIFVNAGAAVLPTILGALVTAGSLILRPRELVRTCRRRPLVALLVLAALAGVSTLVGVLLTRDNAQAAQRADRPRAAGQRDWAKIAVEIIEREQLESALTRPGSAPVATVPASTPVEPVADAPIILGRSPSRCGYDGGPVPLGLLPLWRHTEEDTMFLSSPAVLNGRVYGASCQLDIAGKYGSIFCLDANTGKVIWRTDAIGSENLKPFFSSPAVTQDGKRLVIGQGLHDDADCSLLCFDAATGGLCWRVKTPFHIESSPAIRGDMAVVGAGQIDHGPAAKSGFVLAVRVSDGAELWRFALRDPESSPVVSDDGVVYVGAGFSGNEVVALRSQSDEELRAKKLDRVLWRAPCPYPVTGSIAIAGDLVIAGAGNGDYVHADPSPAGLVLALDRRTGQVRWQRPMDDAVLGPVAARGGKLICPVRNGEVVALDLKDGTPLWRRRVSGKAPILAGTAFTGKHVFAVSRDGYLCVMDAENGQPVERNLYLNDEGKPGEMGLTLSTPTVAGGRVFVGTETGGLRCFVGTRTVP